MSKKKIILVVLFVASVYVLVNFVLNHYPIPVKLDIQDLSFYKNDPVLMVILNKDSVLFNDNISKFKEEFISFNHGTNILTVKCETFLLEYDYELPTKIWKDRYSLVLTFTHMPSIDEYIEYANNYHYQEVKNNIEYIEIDSTTLISHIDSITKAQASIMNYHQITPDVRVAFTWH